MDDPATVAAGIALRFSSKLVREAYASIGNDDWQASGSGWHRTRPYPMGFYADDRNLYYARGWGCHERMMPHERWLLRLAVRRELQRSDK